MKTQGRSDGGAEGPAMEANSLIEEEEEESLDMEWLSARRTAMDSCLQIILS